MIKWMRAACALLPFASRRSRRAHAHALLAGDLTDLRARCQCTANQRSECTLCGPIG